MIGILLLAAAGCSSSGSITGGAPRGAADQSSGTGFSVGARGGTDGAMSASAPGREASPGGGEPLATPKTTVEAFLAAAQKGDMTSVVAATCQDMKNQVADNLKGLTLLSYSTGAPYQMEDRWVVTTTFSVTQNGTPYQGKVDYEVVKEGGAYKWCGLETPFNTPKGAPGIDPSSAQ